MDGGSGGSAGQFNAGSQSQRDGGDGTWAQFYTNFPSGGILLRANGGDGVAGHNSGSSKTGSGGSTSGAFQVLSGSYSYMSAPILKPGMNGNAQTYVASDSRLSTLYYTSVDGGLAGDGGWYYGKGGYGRFCTTQTNTSSNGSAGTTGCCIITEFGAF